MEINPEESEYKWFEAAKSYEKELNSKSKPVSSAAEYSQRIGFCYGLASRQTADVKGFKKLRQLSVDAYEQAAKLYEKDNGLVDNAKSWQCLAIAEYNRSWLASSATEKRKMLEKCLSLDRKAQKVFKNIGDDQNYGKTCNEVALCVCDLHCIIPTSTGKVRIIQEGFSNAATAVSVFSKLKNKDDLILALCVSSILGISLSEVCDPEENKNLCSLSLKYSKEAIELAKEVDNPYSKAMAFWAGANYTTWYEERIEKRTSLEYPEAMLRQASKVKDNYLKGIAYHHLAYAVFADVQEEANPEEKKRKYNDVIEYSKNAEHLLQLVCQESDAATTYMWHSEGYLCLAKEFAVTPSEKLAVLKKALKVGKEGLKHAIQSGCPYAIQVNLMALSRAYYYHSLLEPKKEKRAKLLIRALNYRKKEIASTKKSFPSNAWYTGAGMSNAAQIKAELARLERNNQKKARLFEDAIIYMQNGLSRCKRTLEFADVPAVRVRIADYEDILGELLEEHFLLTGKRENLGKANETYEDAAKCFKKINLPSRAAESFWKIARNEDRLGNYGEAAEKFEAAHVEYELAAEKIPQFHEFYLDYATYVKAWSEIEKAKLAHSHEEYTLARQYYGYASSHLKQSKSWMHLASNFHAWSLLERAEDLSRKDKFKESIEAFEQTIQFFRESKQLLRGKLDEIHKKDEKDLTTRLIEVSNAREKYSQGRIAVEEAKILDKEGDHARSSEKYGAAAIIFKDLLEVASDQIGNEVKPLFYLCQAWKTLTMAEARVSSALYKEAAELFRLANVNASNESSSLLALAHSTFCKALGAGTEFEITRNMIKYTEAKKYLDAAANAYLKAGFQAFSDYTKATQCLFDAYFFMDKAKRETDPDKEAKYFLMAEKVLQVSGESYKNAKYSEKASQVQRLLCKVREERELALSLIDVLHSPTITSSTLGVGSLSLIEEKAVGLERFAHADIEAKLLVNEKNVKVGEYVSLRVQIVNVGKEPVLLTKIENLVPEGFQIIGKPDYCSYEQTNLIFAGRQVSPLNTDEISIVLRPFRRGSFETKPRIVCVDVAGRQLFYSPTSMTLAISETALPGRLSTGFSGLDDLMFGGIPENYAVVLSSPSTDERDALINNFLEAGVKSDQLTFYMTADVEKAKSLAEKLWPNFYVFVCSPSVNVKIEESPNVINLNSVENLTEINISLLKAFRNIPFSKESQKRFCLGVLSDVLLQHHAVITRKWLSQFILDLKSKGFTTLAVLNRQMHPSEEVEAIIGHFDGEIQIFERETESGLRQVLRIRKLHDQRYLENEVVLLKPKSSNLQ